MPFFPLVRGATTAQSPNVRSVMDCLEDATYYVPEYQRDSSQWDIPKKSLFIESLINNLTVPPLIACPEDDENSEKERWQIVDGQQRITTIKEFLQDEFHLATEDIVEYAENVGPLIQGKKFSELSKNIRNQIERYTINFIILPKNLPLAMRLEIFRRINEGGVPLSAHDLRLATFGESPRVVFIRLAGIFNPKREGSRRMIDAAKKKYAINYPWKNHSAWNNWWDNKAQSGGQEASQMYLYYVIARNIKEVGELINSKQIQTAIKLKYDRTNTSVLDLYCAQLQYEELPNKAQFLVNIKTLHKWFVDFELWFNTIKEKKIPSIPLQSSTKIAFFIAAATSTWESPKKVTESEWEQIQIILTKGPGQIKDQLGIELPIPRGKWPGQETLIDAILQACQKIAKS